MKKSIDNFNDKYLIHTELIQVLPDGAIIFKATVKSEICDFTGELKTTMAHASGYVNDSISINQIELDAINRAISLM